MVSVMSVNCLVKQFTIFWVWLYFVVESYGSVKCGLEVFERSVD